jgi:hypothetical protein
MGQEVSRSAAEQSLAADGAIACFSGSFFLLSLNGDRAPQLKAGISPLLLKSKRMKTYEK